MTYEEALPLVKRGRYFGADEVIIRALEKQIPKKHKMVENVLYCPACESYHGRYGDISIPVGSKYCPYCGQAIDWSDEE